MFFFDLDPFGPTGRDPWVWGFMSKNQRGSLVGVVLRTR